MYKTNFAYLAIIPIIVGFFFISCKFHQDDAVEPTDTIMTDSVPADTMETIPVDTTDTIYYRCDTLPAIDGSMQKAQDDSILNKWNYLIDNMMGPRSFQR